MRKNSIIALSFALALAPCYLIGFTKGRKAATLNNNTQTDTLYVREVKSGSTALFSTYSLKGYEISDIPLVLPTTDTTIKVEIRTDTVKVFVPMNEYYFEIPSAKLWLSGYNVSLDKWEVTQTERTVTPAYKHHHIYLSTDALVCKNPRLVVSANYAYTTKRGFAVSGGIGYEPFSRELFGRVGLTWGLSF